MRKYEVIKSPQTCEIIKVKLRIITIIVYIFAAMENEEVSEWTSGERLVLRAPSFSELSRAKAFYIENKSTIYREYEYFRYVFSFPLHEEKCFSYGMPRNEKKKS